MSLSNASLRDVLQQSVLSYRRSRRAPRLGALQPRPGDALGGCLDRRREIRTAPATRQNTHIARLKAPAASSSAPRPSIFMIARVWPPLASASRAARATSFGLWAMRSVSSAPRVPAFSPTRPTSFGEPHQRARLLGAERRLHRGDGLARPQHRGIGHRSCCSIGASHHAARRARRPGGEPLAEPPDLARILHQREARAHRRDAANAMT